MRETNRKVSPSGQHALADQFPYLIASEKSLEEVNSRLEVPVTMENFRPNIIVKTATAFEVSPQGFINVSVYHSMSLSVSFI